MLVVKSDQSESCVKNEKDMMEIDVGQIRGVQRFLSYKSYYGGYKSVIIENADRMNTEAQSCLLKSLEEPTPFSVLVLVSSKPKLLLLTITSRCETVRFLTSGNKELDKETLKAIEEFRRAAKLEIPARLKYAEKLYKEEDYQKLVVGLIHWLHAKGNHNTKVLKGLLQLNQLVSQPQYNHRLALENFLINL